MWACSVVDGGGVQILVVDQEHVVMGVPAVLVAPGELQGDDVPGDAELALEPLPRRTLGDALPRRTLCVYEPR